MINFIKLVLNEILGYIWAEDKEHCEEYGRMLNADPSKVSMRAKKRGLPQVIILIYLKFVIFKKINASSICSSEHWELEIIMPRFRLLMKSIINGLPAKWELRK